VRLCTVYNIYLLFSLANDEIKEDEMGRACSRNEEKGTTCRDLVGKPKENRPLGRTTYRGG
jgi:hypothetical protein